MTCCGVEVPGARHRPDRGRAARLARARDADRGDRARVRHRAAARRARHRRLPQRREHGAVVTANAGYAAVSAIRPLEARRPPRGRRALRAGAALGRREPPPASSALPHGCSTTRGPIRRSRHSSTRTTRRVVGFLASHVRRLALDGRPIRAGRVQRPAGGGPRLGQAGRGRAAAAQLPARAAGPDDSPTAPRTSVRAIWERLGGETLPRLDRLDARVRAGPFGRRWPSGGGRDRRAAGRAPSHAVGLGRGPRAAPHPPRGPTELLTAELFAGAVLERGAGRSACARLRARRTAWLFARDGSGPGAG